MWPVYRKVSRNHGNPAIMSKPTKVKGQRMTRFHLVTSACAAYSQLGGVLANVSGPCVNYAKSAEVVFEYTNNMCCRSLTTHMV